MATTVLRKELSSSAARPRWRRRRPARRAWRAGPRRRPAAGPLPRRRRRSRSAASRAVWAGSVGPLGGAPGPRPVPSGRRQQRRARSPGLDLVQQRRRPVVGFAPTCSRARSSRPTTIGAPLQPPRQPLDQGGGRPRASTSTRSRSSSPASDDAGTDDRSRSAHGEPGSHERASGRGQRRLGVGPAGLRRSHADPGLPGLLAPPGGRARPGPRPRRLATAAARDAVSSSNRAAASATSAARWACTCSKASPERLAAERAGRLPGQPDGALGLLRARASSARHRVELARQPRPSRTGPRRAPRCASSTAPASSAGGSGRSDGDGSTARSAATTAGDQLDLGLRPRPGPRLPAPASASGPAATSGRPARPPAAATVAVAPFNWLRAALPSSTRPSYSWRSRSRRPKRVLGRRRRRLGLGRHRLLASAAHGGFGGRGRRVVGLDPQLRPDPAAAPAAGRGAPGPPGRPCGPRRAPRRAA